MAVQNVCGVRPFTVEALLERLDRVPGSRLARNDKYQLRITG